MASTAQNDAQTSNEVDEKYVYTKNILHII